MAEYLYFDDLSVGDRWKSPGRTVTEADVVNFAAVTWDHDPLHVDESYASETPFRGRIAHGLLGLSMIAGLNVHEPRVRTEAFVAVREWLFLKPIYIGDTVRAIAEIVELTDKKRRRGTVVWRRQLVNQRDEIVQEGTLETIVAVKKMDGTGG